MVIFNRMNNKGKYSNLQTKFKNKQRNNNKTRYISHMKYYN